MRVEGLFTAR